jgi:phosphoesterase RecJ-like protein
MRALPPAGIEPVINFINRYQSFLVTGHAAPEGDCLSSTLAMTHFLKKIGKKVVALNPDPSPDAFEFLSGYGEVSRQTNPAEFEAAFIVDCPDLSRVGEFSQKLVTWGKPLCNIDHHETNTLFGEINYIRPLAASTGEVVLEVISAYGFDMDLSLAKMIYTSLFCDTGGFRYESTTRRSLELAGKLIEFGVSPWEIAEKITENEPLRRIHLLQEALASLETFSAGRAAAIFITQKTFAKTQTSEVDTDRVINFARSIRGVEVAIQFLEKSENCFQISFRSKGKINVGELCEHLSGKKGHHLSANLVLSSDLDSAKERVYKAVEFILEKYS